MAKIERKVQKIFGGSLSPTGNIAIYGSKEAGSPSYSDNLDTIQSLSWLQGIMGATSPTKAPYVQDLNAIFYVITKQLAYLFQSGIAEWNATTEYYANSSFVVVNGNIYRAIADNTGIQPTVTSNWSSYWQLLEERYRSLISYSNTNSSILGGYPINSILDFIDANTGCVYKIKSLINNNTYAPSLTNIRISSSQTGSFFWELIDNQFIPGDMKPFGGSVIPNGWLLCDGSEISKTTYSFLYSIIGDNFGTALDSSKFVLPDYRNKTFWGGDTSNVGTVKDSALPNIKGKDGLGWSQQYVGITNNAGYRDGALAGEQYVVGAGVNVNPSGHSISSGQNIGIGFDASLSSSVYKNDQTIVQPPAIQTPFIIKY